MSLTFNLELDSKPNKKGEKLLMIRCTYQGKHKRINTGIHLLPNYWDTVKKKIKISHPLYSETNKTITQLLQEVEGNYLALLRDKDEISLVDLIKSLNKPKSINFFEFAKSYKLNDFKAKKMTGTYRRYEAVLNKLKEFAGDNLTIKNVDYTLLKQFENYLIITKKNGRDTVSSNLSVLRSIINEAIKHEFYDKRNPFESISLKYTSNTKSKLTIEELRSFVKVSLPPIHSLILARDFFMACFYAGGCRAGDMIRMKWEHIKDGRLEYVQQKTQNKLILPILPELKEIIERYKTISNYIFPLLKEGDIETESVTNSKITYLNKYLKEVCKYAGIFKKISTHCARHSFSDISLSLNQNDIFSLKDVLGHSSVKTTEGYLINKNYSNSEHYLNNIKELIKKEDIKGG